MTSDPSEMDDEEVEAMADEEGVNPLKVASDKQIEKKKLHPTFELWDKYEQVAMHFNDLLIKLRVQALGGVVALSALAGSVLREENAIKWEAMGYIFLALAILWCSIWLLDACYYYRLLFGAVEAIMEVEKESRANHDGLKIKLSTCIETAVRGGEKSWRRYLWRWQFPFGAFIFYLLVLGVLLGLMWICFRTGAPASLHHQSVIL